MTGHHWPTNTWDVLHYKEYVRNAVKLKIREISSAHNFSIAQLLNRLEILHRARQYNCRALYKCANV